MPVPDGFWEVSWGFSSPAPMGSSPTVTFGVRSATTLPSAVLTSVTAAIHDNFNESFLAEYLPSTITVRSLDQEATGPSGLTGSTGTTGALPSTAVLVRKATGFIGKQNRGRMYVPGLLTDAQVDEGGVITSSEVTGLQGAFTGFLADLDTLDIPMVIIHKAPKSGGEPSAPTGVTSLTVEPIVATQRRRLRK